MPTLPRTPSSIGAWRPSRASGRRPRLLFSAWETDHEAVLRCVQERLPVRLIGSTSSGEMSSEMGYQEDSITLALFASDDVDITGGMATHLWDDVPAAARSAVEQAQAKTGKEPRLYVTTPSAEGEAGAARCAPRGAGP